MKRLLAVVRNNRKGPLKLFPLALTGIVVGGIVIFFSVFADPLLERALEAALEAAFEAKSDVYQLRIRPLKFSIGINHITVANCDKPMTNLFEMGKTRIRLRPEAVLRGKVYIEEIRADSIQFGTPRKTSGAIPRRPPKVKEEKPKSDAPPLVDLKNFDAMGLLNREFDKLRTPKLYDEAINAYNETVEKWKKNVDVAKARTDELKASAQPILNFKVPNVDVKDMASVTKAVNDINKTVSEINTMVNTVQTAVTDATNMVTGIEKDINTAKSLEQNAKTAITDDLNLLKSYIDLSSGSALAALEPSIREILSDTAETYVDYGLRVLDILLKLKAESDAKPKTEKPPKKEPKVVFKGRDVIYPTRAYPSFYLGVLASDFVIQPWKWAFDLRDVSSDPDLTGKPVTLKLGVSEQTGDLKDIEFNGSGDFRTKATDRFTANVTGSGFPVSLGNALSSVGVNGFNGGAAFSVNFTGHTDGGVSGGGAIKISNAKLLDPKGTIAEALADAVQEAKNIDIGVQYTHRLNANDDFKISTNLTELLATAIKRIVDTYSKKAMDEIEKALRARVEQYIDGKFVAKEDLDALLKLARGDKAAAEDLKNTLNNKKAELEQKVKGYTDQGKAVVDQALQQGKEELDKAAQQAKEAADKAAQQAKDEAAKQAQQAAQDAMKGQMPSVQVPSVPAPSVPVPSVPSGGGGLKLPGR